MDAGVGRLIDGQKDCTVTNAVISSGHAVTVTVRYFSKIKYAKDMLGE